MQAMTEQAVRLAANTLLTHYSFDLGGYSADVLVQHWLDHYPMIWLRMAIIEALYQGRYKAVSVDQILTMWHRRSQPVCHYNHEFERMICNRFPRNLLKDEGEQLPILLAEVNSSERTASAQLTSSEPVEPVLPNTSPVPDMVSDVAADAQSLTGEAIADAAAPKNTEGIEPDSPQTTFVPSTLTDSPQPKELASREEVIHQPIHQFVPSVEATEFYAKLKAVSVADDELLSSSEAIGNFN